MYESGLRTIRTSRDVNGRLFLYLKSQFYKAFPHFSVFPSILRSTHIKYLLLVYVFGISRFDNSLYQQKEINHGSY
ncbi:hypothetical protein MU9_118 [Morganella morganii subsp. morganii KT]|uniref:Uncharacterized protein n=1 Tax=Morganella morganii subsp. morganii KT TaxID=1124991 RepID=M1S3R6_MORMO|nr:hypothetical protein MU9_118 [Morganella morganii subsp. morganii KT]